MNSKKSICVSLCVVLLTVLLVSCGGGTEPADSSSADPQPGVGTSTTKETDSTDLSTTTGSESVSSSATQGSTTLHTGSTTGTTVTTTRTAKEATMNTTAGDHYTGLDYTKYNFEAYMQPVWQGDTVYNEIVMFFPNGQTKKIDPAPLLYTPTEVISVRSFDLKTEYVEGVDYTVENGCIALTANSRIKAWAYDEYYLATPSASPAGGLPSISVPGRYYAFGDGKLFSQYQVCVTYTHKEVWDGPRPAYQGGKLPKTTKTLAKKDTLNVVYYGDSITVGKEASGVLKIAPNMPRWADLVTEQLERATGATINATNTAKGGQTSQWGLANIEENVVRYDPDLVVLAFGMNDGSRQYTTGVYKDNIKKMIEAVRKKNPNCEFLLVATQVPNPDESSRQGPQAKYAACLNELADSMSGVAVANVTEIHQYLLTQKRYGDMTANNVNHPNDFLIRVQAQIVAQALIPSVG